MEEMFEDEDMRSLFDMKRNMPSEHFKAHIEFIKNLYNQEKIFGSPFYHTRRMILCKRVRKWINDFNKESADQIEVDAHKKFKLCETINLRRGELLWHLSNAKNVVRRYLTKQRYVRIVDVQ